LKHLARSLVVLLIVSCAWRYGRESVRAWLAHATRAPAAPAALPLELPSGEHYSPAEDLERWTTKPSVAPGSPLTSPCIHSPTFYWLRQ
jgi:hypothetical protein